MPRALVLVVVVALACDADPAPAPTGASTDGSATDANLADATIADAAYSCTPPPACDDLDVGGYFTEACCSPVTTCGYVLPPLDADTATLFPQAQEFYDMLVAGDPNGGCAAESFFFGPRPGLYEHREQSAGGPDILITPDCDAFTVLAFILPGCCLPDDTCGLSTDESWTTLASLASGVDAGFARPECVPAEVLNQQFEDSVVLEDFARTVARGRCDYAALDARLAD